jgi:Rod binding domain-containing protein
MKRSIKTINQLEQINREILDLTTRQIGCTFKEFETLHVEIMAKQLERRRLESARTISSVESPSAA